MGFRRRRLKIGLKPRAEEEAVLAAAAAVATCSHHGRSERPLHGLTAALFGLPSPAAGQSGRRHPRLTRALLLALREARQAYLKYGAACSQLHGDYVELLTASLRSGLLPQSRLEEPLGWLREALSDINSGNPASSAGGVLTLPVPVATKKRRRKRGSRNSRDDEKRRRSWRPKGASGVTGESAPHGPSPERLARLVNVLMSPDVQMLTSSESELVPARLSPPEVVKVLEDNVPGVRQLIYRQQPGVYAVDFIKSAYADGLRAFQGTDLHEHLMSLLRLIVHYGQEGKLGAKEYLRETAEAFTDCQAVQARTIEKVGLRIRGVQLDFRGHLVRLVGEYKSMAVKMLAIEECMKLGGPDEYNDPAHYESRLLADLGERVGLNEADVRQAELDEHARRRFPRLAGARLEAAAIRLQQFFDCEALLQAFVAEASTFGAESTKDSLPSLFLDWASDRMTQKHVVLDEDTCTRVDVGTSLALAVFESVFLGEPGSPPAEKYRGEQVLGLFLPAPGGDEPKREEFAAATRKERMARLMQRLLCPSIQVPAPDNATEEDARLSPEEVRKVFVDNVPGVEKLTYRGQYGNFSIKFMVSAYTEGFRAFHGTELDEHLRSLMRLVIHHGHEGKVGAAKYLREVAEAFTDCQAVQARTVERVGLQIRGVSLDFRGHLVHLVGEYKAMAIKILAVEECTKLGGPDEFHDPAHFENRLVADLGDRLGLNAAHIRQAHLDEHAESRFPKFGPARRKKNMDRARELFDLEALLKAFAAEASTFGESSAKDSLPRIFLDWASERMTRKHVILDEETCTKVEVEDDLALAVFESVFLGRTYAPLEATYRGEPLNELFTTDAAAAGEAEEVAREAEEAEAQDTKARKEEEEEEAGKAMKGKGKFGGLMFGGKGMFMGGKGLVFGKGKGDDDSESEEDSESNGEDLPRWEVDLDSHWAPLERELVRKIVQAEVEGRTEVEYFSRGFPYRLDLQAMAQINTVTGKQRIVRRKDAGDED